MPNASFIMYQILQLYCPWIQIRFLTLRYSREIELLSLYLNIQTFIHYGTTDPGCTLYTDLEDNFLGVWTECKHKECQKTQSQPIMSQKETQSQLGQSANKHTDIITHIIKILTFIDPNFLHRYISIFNRFVWFKSWCQVSII